MDLGAVTIGDYLTELGSSAPTPGGGAVAALSAAQAAALVEMVGNLSVGRSDDAEVERTMVAAVAEAGALRTTALRLAADDAAAFSAVLTAYRLPKGDDALVAARQAAIQQALVAAAEVPMRAAAVAATVVELAERIRPGANRNVLSDVAVAAVTARAAIEASAVNVAVNAVGLADPAVRGALQQRIAVHRAAVADADRVLRAVEEQLGR